MIVVYSTCFAIAILVFILSDSQQMDLRFVMSGGAFLFLSILATLWFVVKADELPPGINETNEPPRERPDRNASP